jgi:uncharacterized membrane protein YtjA (UPF0391 family)
MKYPMFIWSIIFLVVAIVAGLLGFTAIAGVAIGLAKIVFLAAIVLFLLFLIGGIAATKSIIGRFNH